jgi:hypothetical protein
MRDKTTNRYIRTLTQLLAFTLRAQLNLQDLHLPLAPLVAEKAKALIAALSSKLLLWESVHALVIAILSHQRALDSPFICPGSRFIIFRNYKLSGQVCNVEDIHSFLAELRWPLRCSAFWEMVVQSKDIGANDDVDVIK